MSMVFSEIPYESDAFFPLIGCFETVKYSLDELLFFVSCETEITRKDHCYFSCSRFFLTHPAAAWINAAFSALSLLSLFSF